MWAFRIVSYSVIIGILLFFTTAILPETKLFNLLSIDIPKWLFIIFTSIFFILIKDKWWIKTISILLSLVVAIALIVLFIP